uniref:p13 protein n=1 Tax=Cystovirus phi6 TaxID=10879 RepID=W8JK37_9VIRU|nr:P13 protein [Cystovirus phi6]
MVPLKISTLESQLQPLVELVATETPGALVAYARGLSSADRSRLYRLLRSLEQAIPKLSSAVVSATTLAARGL